MRTDWLVEVDFSDLPDFQSRFETLEAAQRTVAGWIEAEAVTKVEFEKWKDPKTEVEEIHETHTLFPLSGVRKIVIKWVEDKSPL